MFGIKKLLRQILERLQVLEESAASHDGKSAQSAEQLALRVSELSSAANRHDMAIEDLLDSWEELQEKQKEETRALSEEYTGGFFYKRYPEEKTLPRGVLAYSDTKPFVRETIKPGRNDPCPCGSGLKFKRCCLGKGIYD